MSLWLRMISGIEFQIVGVAKDNDLILHFWHDHLWPKLATSIIKFCRRKRSFQWYPDGTG